jgi:hypothetical protein
MSLGKYQLLLLVQRVFVATNHFQEMRWCPTAWALDEALGSNASGAVPIPMTPSDTKFEC